jgi:hypothetical protein
MGVLTIATVVHVWAYALPIGTHTGVSAQSKTLWNFRTSKHHNVRAKTLLSFFRFPKHLHNASITGQVSRKSHLLCLKIRLLSSAGEPTEFVARFVKWSQHLKVRFLLGISDSYGAITTKRSRCHLPPNQGSRTWYTFKVNWTLLAASAYSLWRTDAWI